MAAEDRPVSDIDDLRRIMARLRDRDSGCPWDLEQDFRSIAPYTLEEAYEVVDAIERNDAGDLRDELGDLLFQVVFHARMAEERGWFTLDDVITSICEKMLRRHPHVFGDETIADAETQTIAWEQHKAQERGEQQSALDGVAQSLPALTRACKLQRRASRVGFDWPSIHGVADKVEEELEELNDEIRSSAGVDALTDESGDLLFAAVNLIRHAGIDPERALRQGNAKFTRRFQQVETLVRQSGKAFSEADLDTLDLFWEQAKQLEKSD